MGKLTKAGRLVQLMDLIGWEGHTNWSKVDEKYQRTEIPRIKVWLQKHLSYIEPEDCREIVSEYFIGGLSRNPGSAFYIKKDRGVSVLIGLYKYQREQQDGVKK